MTLLWPLPSVFQVKVRKRETHLVVCGEQWSSVTRSNGLTCRSSDHTLGWSHMEVSKRTWVYFSDSVGNSKYRQTIKTLKFIGRFNWLKVKQLNPESKSWMDAQWRTHSWSIYCMHFNPLCCEHKDWKIKSRAVLQFQVYKLAREFLNIFCISHYMWVWSHDHILRLKSEFWD